MRDPLRVGTSDLDPLGGLGGFHDGGGMLFNPFDNRQQPPDLSGLPRFINLLYEFLQSDVLYFEF